MSALIPQLKYSAKELHFFLFGNRGAFKSVYERTVISMESALSPEVCADLIEIIEATIDGSGSELWHDEFGSDIRIWEFEKCIPNYVSQLGIDDLLCQISCYLGTSVRDWLLMANRTSLAPNSLGSGGGFHRDSAFSHQIKVIWYLSDVSELNGPFSYVPGSHKKLYGQDSLLFPPETRLVGTPKKLVKMTGSAGLRLVADTRCIHGGIPVMKDARYAITLYTVTKHNGLDDLRSGGA